MLSNGDLNYIGMFFMSFKSENEVTESLDTDQAHALPVTSDTANSEQRTPAPGSLIGKAVYIKGDVSAREDLMVDGRIDGTIALKVNKLEIGLTGRIQANVFARVIVVSGEMIGDLYASDQVIITKSGRVTGDIYTADVSIEDGALVKGSIDMQKQYVFKQHAVPDMQDQNNEKSSSFGFLFKKGRDISHTSAVLLPDLRENLEIADELTSLPVDINLGTTCPYAERSIIGETVVIKGELISEEDVIVQGQVEGVIYFKNCSLGIGAHAEIKANIYVKSMVHHGRTSGDIYASDQVSIKKPGQVFGRIFSPRVSTEKGAVLMGSISMEPQNIEEAFANFSGAAATDESYHQENNTTAKSAVNVMTEDTSDESVLTGATGAAGMNKNTAWPIFYPRT
jgi:cytoskeletal protein CcmA (bactofilin family)